MHEFTLILCVSIFLCFGYTDILVVFDSVRHRLQDRVPNRELVSRAGMGRVTCLIRERQLRFYGHVVRFPMARTPIPDLT